MILCVVLVAVLSIISSPQVFANFVVEQPKPITGTFLWDDMGPMGESEWNQYFQDLTELGMDTLIQTTTGSTPSLDKLLPAWSYFDDAYQNPNNKSTMENLLIAAEANKFTLYLGTPGTNFDIEKNLLGNPDDPNTGAGMVVDYTIQSIEKAKKIYQDHGWNWDTGVVKGIYINNETAIRWLPGWWTIYYRNVASRIKTKYPNLKIMISPYKFYNQAIPGQDFRDTYDLIYTNTLEFIKNTPIDIIAPQDSVGTQKVISATVNEEHYKALSKAVADFNNTSSRKVELWDNIETFYCDSLECATKKYRPTDFSRLLWQVRTGDKYVSKSITWISTWSLNSAPFLENYRGSNISNAAQLRSELRYKYLNIPIIADVSVFNSNLIIKGYNFGGSISNPHVFLHYRNPANQELALRWQPVLHSTNDINKKYSELLIPISSIPNFDNTKPYSIAVENESYQVQYYDTSDPQNSRNIVFPEIIPSPIPSPTSTPIPQIPGDANQDGLVTIVDFSVWKDERLAVLNGAIVNSSYHADFNHDGWVDLVDFSIWKDGYLKSK